MTDATFIPLPGFVTYPEAEMLERAEHFLSEAKRRRTVREFSDRPVPRALIETCLQTAGTAVSGANMQPWQFVAVQDRGIKRDIRVAAEAEERAFYNGKAPREWLDALAPLGTDADKPFLDIAPWLIAVFLKKFSEGEDGRRLKNYYTA